ncbi:MAG: BrnT family toxin [Rhodobacteraceae bacterium]|nr:BrnT family toxin [Paracoccaceae bacterium]
MTHNSEPKFCRGFDFAYAKRVFLDSRRVVAQDRWHGLWRRSVLGTINGRVYAVVFTMLDSATRIVSARKASAKEIENYDHYTHRS